MRSHKTNKGYSIIEKWAYTPLMAKFFLFLFTSFFLCGVHLAHVSGSCWLVVYKLYVEVSRVQIEFRAGSKR